MKEKEVRPISLRRVGLSARIGGLDYYFNRHGLRWQAGRISPDERGYQSKTGEVYQGKAVWNGEMERYVGHAEIRFWHELRTLSVRSKYAPFDEI